MADLRDDSIYTRAVLEQLADDAQQAFSSETYLTLCLTIPALEALCAAWLM
jgi:hypothetical protein